MFLKSCLEFNDIFEIIGVKNLIKFLYYLFNLLLFRSLYLNNIFGVLYLLFF